ncbi:MAG: hypothetical protein DHS20C08_02370 [Rhodomicrobium sp.]|nr:MAG: hypothetical protein DHS20C08_02370 [Rhodomicrobium sp.]
MYKSISLAAAFAIFSVVALSTVSLPGSAKAYACKSFPNQTVGVRKGKIMARIAARKGWVSNTKSQYGLSWSVWKVAQGKSLTCSKISTNQGLKWRCLASAKPCNYVVQ